jgi:hypothetical protein
MAPFRAAMFAPKDRGEIHEVHMTSKYSWYEFYKTALLETDWTKMQERIQEAESAMDERQRVLSADHGGAPEERQALADAISGLRVLRRDAADWQDRQTHDETPDGARVSSLIRPAS